MKLYFAIVILVLVIATLYLAITKNRITIVDTKSHFAKYIVTFRNKITIMKWSHFNI